MHLRHFAIGRSRDTSAAQKAMGENPASASCPAPCRGRSPELLLLDQGGSGEVGQRAGVRSPCVIANSRGRNREEMVAEVRGEVTTLLEGPELSKPLSEEKNRSIENSCAHSHGRPPCRLCFQAGGARPCWSPCLSQPGLFGMRLSRVRRTEELQQRKPMPSSKAWQEAVMVSSLKAGCGGLGREVEPSVHHLGQQRRSIRLAWPQRHPLCHRPPRLSIRQCLSGRFGGS